MEEVAVKEEKERETRKKEKDEHILPKTVKVTGIKIEQAQKRGPSAIPLSEATVRMETKPSMQQSSMKIAIVPAEVASIHPRKKEAISIKEGEPILERKSTEKKEMIPISERAPTIIPVTPSASVKKENFQVQDALKPKVTPIEPTFKPQTKPLRLEREVKVAREKASLEPEPVELAIPEIVELVKMRTREREVKEIEISGIEEEEIRALEEMPIFYDVFLKGGFGGITTIDRPTCIIISKSHSESYVDAVALICREFYRIKKGGKPSPRILSTGSKEEVEKWLEAGERIFIVDDSRCELINLSKIKRLEGINWGHLYDRLRELSFEDYGFVIFHVDKKWARDFRSKLEEIVYMIPKLFLVESNGLSPKIKEEIAGMYWGFVSSKGETFDEVFCSAEKAFYDRLEEIGKDEWLMHCTKPHREGPESSEHRLLKALVVKTIAKEKGIERELIPEKIKTEYLEKGFTVDIFVNDIAEEYKYVEVETLYGTGLNPVDKIDHETLQRYAHGGIRKVKIVMLPMPFLTFLKNLISLRRTYKAEHGIDVKFYTVDIKNEKLISLDSTIKRLKELKRQIDEHRLEAQKAIEIFKLKEMGLTQEEIKGLM
jgi:hypothetical protein